MLVMEKAEARALASATRAKAHAAHATLAPQLAQIALRDGPPPDGAIIAGYWPRGDEINVVFLMETLAAMGFDICLPVTPPRGQPLTFCRWRPGDALIPGRFGTLHTDAPGLVPDIILVPLLAFDAQGNRLGYGGGYYDRTFEALPGALRLGCAYAAQEIPRVPSGPFDVRLHALVTERGFRRFDEPPELALKAENLG